MARRLTQKIVREYVRTVGGRFKRTLWDDYQLTVGADTYHANDLLDIIETTRVMCGSHPNIALADSLLEGYNTQTIE